MNEEKQKIIDTATEVFLSEGFYRIPVDELAAKLKMSKKTIYKHFPSKDILVKEVALSFIRKLSRSIEEIFIEEMNAIEKLIKMFAFIMKTLMGVNRKFLSDLENYAQDVWKELDEFRSKFMMAHLSKIIEQGKKEELFIDKPSLIIITIFISSIRGVINPEFLIHNRFSVKDAFLFTIEILMNGITTSKGKKLFKRFKLEQLNETI